MSTLIDAISGDVFEKVISGTFMSPDEVQGAGLSKHGFAGFYRYNAPALHNMRAYTDLRQQVADFAHEMPFVALMDARKYALVLCLKAWQIGEIKYFVFLNRSPRKLILASQDDLLIETDDPALLFAKIDEVLSGVDMSNASGYKRDELDIAKHMLIRLATSFERSAPKKRESADIDDIKVNEIDGILRLIGYDRHARRRL